MARILWRLGEPAHEHTAHHLQALWQDVQHCRNCGTALHGPYCGQCGQKRVQRLGSDAVRAEAWSSMRWFEWSLLQAAWRLARRPGVVAREYVLGMRQRHMHPLKLLLAALGVHLLLLTQTQYLAPSSASEEARRAFELVRAYSKWSFSLGIVAIFGSTWLVFRKRWGYNATELLTLAVYVHFMAICLQALNQLPLLAWHSADMLRWHKQWSPYYMNLLQTTLVVVALRQFFALGWRQHAPLLVLAAALYSAGKWAVSHLYARAVVELVLWQLD